MNARKLTCDNEPAKTEQNAEETVVPVYAEEIHAGTQKMKTGGVRIHKTVEEHQEIIDQPLETEEVEVRRVVKNEVVSGPLANRQSGDTLIIPVVKEVLKVEKQWVLTEELHVTKRRSQKRSEQPVTIRRERVSVERTDAHGQAVSPATEQAELQESASGDAEPDLDARRRPSLVQQCDEPRRHARTRKNRLIK